MSITVTFGNSGEKPITDPTRASQIFNSQGNFKCTVGLGPGQHLVVDNDLDFVRFMGLSQSNRANVVFGAADANGNFTHAAEDQSQMLIYRNPRPGFADVVSSPKIRLESAGGFENGVFAYNKG